VYTYPVGGRACRPPGRPRAAQWCGARVADAVNIDQFLRDRGFDTPEAARRAREVLQERGLTRAGKQAFAADKLVAAEAALAAALARVCGDACLRIDRWVPGPAREAVRVMPRGCEICGGSNNRRAALECARALARKRVRRVVIVGGTAATQHELHELLAGSGLEIRYVDGTKASHSGKDALANTRWAQLIVIWGATPLRHAVSELYTSEPPPDGRILTVSRRGVEALCGEIVRSYT